MRGAGGARVVVFGVAVRFDLDDLPEVGGVDHESGAEVEPHVVDVSWCAVEGEVAWLQRGPAGQEWSGVVLGLGGAGEFDAGGVVGGVGEAAAVEAAVARAVAAPDVGLAELSASDGELTTRDQL